MNKINSKKLMHYVLGILILSSNSLFAQVDPVVPSFGSTSTTVTATVQVNATTALSTTASTISFASQAAGPLSGDITSSTTTLTSVYGGSSQNGQNVTAVPATLLVGATNPSNTIPVTFYAGSAPIASGGKVITTAAAVDDTATVDINAKIASGTTLKPDFFSGSIVFTSSSGA